MKVTVLGAGIAGVTTAYYLAKMGYAVEVVDKHDEVAMGTSFANGCQLSASNAEVWNSWRNIQKGIKWMLSKDAPLLINPMPSIHKYSWLVQFMLNIKNREQNTKQTCEMALEAHHLYKEIMRDEDISDTDVDKLDLGILHIYRNQEELEHARATNNLYTESGLKRWEISRNEMLDIEPSLKETSDTIIGGFYNDTDFTADIRKFCVKLSEVLRTKYNVKFTTKLLDPTSVLTYRQQGPVVVCAGVESRYLCSNLNLSLPIYPVKGYSVTVDIESCNEHAPSVSILDDQTKIVCSRLGNNLRVAGTAEFNGYNTRIRSDRVKPLINWIQETFPGVNTNNYESWAGLRPMTPNMMPIVGHSGKYSIWLNTGHGHLGWTLSAFTAKQVAEQIRDSYVSIS